VQEITISSCLRANSFSFMCFRFYVRCTLL